MVSDCGPACTDFTKTAYACQAGNSNFNRTGTAAAGKCWNYQVQTQVMYDFVDPTKKFFFKVDPDATQLAAWTFSGPGTDGTDTPPGLAVGADQLEERFYLDGCRWNDQGCAGVTGTERCQCSQNIDRMDANAVWPNYQLKFPGMNTFTGAALK